MSIDVEARKKKVQVKGLTKKYGDLLVLNDISFDVYDGEFLCIVGPTGCGKTTFLNVLTKLVPTTEGEIYIDGEPADPLKHNLSFVFQEPSSMSWRKVEQNIRVGMEIKRWSKEKADQRVEQ